MEAIDRERVANDLGYNDRGKRGLTFGKDEVEKRSEAF